MGPALYQNPDAKGAPKGNLLPTACSAVQDLVSVNLKLTVYKLLLHLRLLSHLQSIKRQSRDILPSDITGQWKLHVLLILIPGLYRLLWQAAHLLTPSRAPQ